MKTVAYLRVSTIDQDLNKNKADILKLANDKKLGNVKFVEEKISGKVNWKKRKIYDIVRTLKAGDNIVVSELSRLGRSMLECMEILSVATERKINIYAVHIFTGIIGVYLYGRCIISNGAVGHV